MTRLTLPLFAVCLALTGWAVWERMENSRLSDRVAELEKSSAGSKPSGDNRVAGSIPASAGTAKNTLPATSGKETASDGTATESGKTMADSFAKMMKAPGAKDMIKVQARMGVDMLYRDLYDLLNLPDGKRRELEKLIGEKATAGMEIGFSAIGEKKTPEELKAISDQLAATTKEMDAKIKDLLGEEDFNKLKRYEDSASERMQLQTFNSMLASKDLAMDEATETKLMDAMYEERTKLPFASEFANQQNPDVSRFTPDNLTRFGEEYGQLSQRVVGRAESILSAPQFEVFRQSQEQMTNMTKMQLEMAGKMFGGE